MILALKRVYEAPEPGDGMRILVDRLWPRGIARDKAGIDLWLRDIAPSDALRKRFHAKPEAWDAFCAAYEAELQGEAAQAAAKDLRARLCGEGISPPYRELGRLRPGKARAHEDSRRRAANRAKRERAHDRETDPRHGRSRPRDRGGNRRLLDRSAEQSGPARGLSHNGGGDLGADGRKDRWLRPKRRHRGVAAWDRASPTPP